jgi:hypothetical protein
MERSEMRELCRHSLMVQDDFPDFAFCFIRATFLFMYTIADEETKRR